MGITERLTLALKAIYKKGLPTSEELTELVYTCGKVFRSNGLGGVEIDNVIKEVSKMYNEVKDDDVCMIWECQDSACDTSEDQKRTEVGPDFYQDSGTPMCMCGEDMTYIKTMVKSK